MAGEREEVLEAGQWSKGIEGVHRRIGARSYLKGLLSPVERKNGW